MIYKKIDITVLTDGVDEELAKAWIDHRLVIKKPLTQYAFKLCMSSAERVAMELGVTPAWAIEETIEAGYQGIRSLYLEKFVTTRTNGAKSTRNMTLQDEMDTTWSH